MVAGSLDALKAMANAG